MATSKVVLEGNIMKWIRVSEGPLTITTLDLVWFCANYLRELEKHGL